MRILNRIFASVFTVIFITMAAFDANAQSILEITDGPPGDITDLTEVEFAVDGTVGSVKMLEFSNTEKTLYFIPMIHVGEPAFYEAVADAVKVLKSRGADLFYEFVDFEAASREDQLRIRAMLGFLPTPSFYADTVSDGLVAQDNELFLGFPGGRDVNVDMTAGEIADAYETQIGKLEISDENQSTPVSGLVLPTGDIAKSFEIIVDLRNIHLAEAIDASPNDIVVLYGAAHGPGTLDELVERDGRWARVPR